MLISQDAPKKCTNTAKKVINFIIINWILHLFTDLMFA
jgi:hypothetical protein